MILTQIVIIQLFIKDIGAESGYQYVLEFLNSRIFYLVRWYRHHLDLS